MSKPVDDSTETARGFAAKTWVGINLNDTVRVRLTDVGLEEYRRQAELFNVAMTEGRPQFPTTPKLDQDGFYCTQLWDLIRTFGHLVGMGSPLPFETRIELNADSIRPPRLPETDTWATFSAGGRRHTVRLIHGHWHVWPDGPSGASPT